MDAAFSLDAAAGRWAMAAFVGYLALVTGIGVWAARFSSAGVSEFFLGGRRMGRVVVALSAVVSGRSSWLILGVTGMAYTRGVSAVWAVAGYIVVELLLFLYYARRLRRFTEAYDCITVPDFFAARLGERPGAPAGASGALLRLALVAVILAFMVGYVAAQFVAGGKAFASSFGLDPTTGVLLTAAIVLAYTVLGGFLAVSLTDLVQAIFMLGALVALPAMAVARAGGLGAMAGQLAALDPALVDPGALGFGALVGFLGIGLGSPGSPHILARYMSIRDPDQLRTAAVVGTVWNVLMAWGAVVAGLAGRVLVPDPASLPGADPESLYPVLSGELLPPVVFGLLIAAVFAAIMSTADSQLLVAASAVVRDLWEQVLRRGRPADPRRMVVASRLVVVALVAAAVGLGRGARELVFWLVLFSWAGLGAALGPTSILALYWRGTTRAGVLAGLLAGTATTIAWKLTPALSGRLYELIPGFAAGLVATLVVSRLTRPPAGVAEMFAAMGSPAEPGPPGAR
jgi:SSS family solute:Na+ symporter